jgi:GNAT superfamily N-acetyltransferase
MTIHIRPATPADAPAIAGLNAAYDDLRATPDEIAALMVKCTGLETMFLAEVDCQVVGMAALRLLPTICDPVPYAELNELFVAADYRRLGVASALVAHIEQVAKAAGATQLVLQTAFKNHRAHTFYHARGYALYLFAMHKPLNVPGDEQVSPS